MSKALRVNTIDAIWGDCGTLLPGSARVLWWNSQEYAREGGSWIGIETCPESSSTQPLYPYPLD